MDDKACDKTWQKTRVATRRQLGMSLAMQPWTPRASLRGLPRRERALEQLDTCFWKMFKKHEDEQQWLSRTFVHVFQNTARTPVTEHMPCFLTKSDIYSFGKDQVVSGMGHLQAMGWPVDRVPSTIASDAQCRDLAGQSFSVPTAALLQAIMIANPWAPWHQ